MEYWQIYNPHLRQQIYLNQIRDNNHTKKKKMKQLLHLPQTISNHQPELCQNDVDKNRQLTYWTNYIQLFHKNGNPHLIL